MVQTCLFCQIVQKEIPAKIVYEDENLIAFRDINPIAPIHILVVPKEHIANIGDWKVKDKDLLWKIMETANKIAKNEGVADSGYRLIFNSGPDAGQTVEHIHLHLLGGEKLSWR